MKFEISLRKKLAIVNIIGTATSLIVIFSPTPGSIIHRFNTISLIDEKSTEFIQDVDSTKKVNLGLPIRLKIPKIGVDAIVKYTGLTSDGALDAPESPSDVAWFELGERPGEDGNSIIIGHSGWKNNTPAVFDNLYKLDKEDKIYIEDEEGMIITFVVRELKIYREDANTLGIFSSSDKNAHLNLITCGGVWDKVAKSYSNRLVVFTDKETK